jgi:hypothetical protein
LKVLCPRLCRDPQMPTCCMVVEAGYLFACNNGVGGGGDDGTIVWLHGSALHRSYSGSSFRS